MIGYAVMLVLRKNRLQAAIAVFIALMFFVIAMEEISWGQRIFDVESSEFFLEHNMQNEINLHNRNTKLSEAVYYTGAFTIYCCYPSFENKLQRYWTELNCVH